jgi:hypothetical protein
MVAISYNTLLELFLAEGVTVTVNSERYAAMLQNFLQPRMEHCWKWSIGRHVVPAGWGYSSDSLNATQCLQTHVSQMSGVSERWFLRVMDVQKLISHPTTAKGTDYCSRGYGHTLPYVWTCYRKLPRMSPTVMQLTNTIFLILFSKHKYFKGSIWGKFYLGRINYGRINSKFGIR